MRAYVALIKGGTRSDGMLEASREVELRDLGYFQPTGSGGGIKRRWPSSLRAIESRPGSGAAKS